MRHWHNRWCKLLPPSACRHSLLPSKGHVSTKNYGSHRTVCISSPRHYSIQWKDHSGAVLKYHRCKALPYSEAITQARFWAWWRYSLSGEGLLCARLGRRLPENCRLQNGSTRGGEGGWWIVNNLSRKPRFVELVKDSPSRKGEASSATYHIMEKHNVSKL